MENREEFSAANSPNLSPPRIKLLKAQLSTIEASIPSECFDVCWSEDIRRSFALKLLMASTAEELLQSIAMLECSIKRDSFSPNFVPTSEFSSFRISERSCTPDCLSSEAVPVLPWIPLTAAAASLRLMEMDSAIYYTPEQKENRKTDNEPGFFSKYSSICSSLGIYVNDAAQDGGTLGQNGSGCDIASQGANSRRGRGRPRGPSRTRGGKTNKLDRFPSRKGQQTVSTRKGRGRWSQGRSVAKYYAEESEQGIELEDTENPQDQPGSKETSARIEGTETAATSSGRSGSDDDNAQASVDDYEVKVGFSGLKPGELEEVGEDRQPLENADEDYDDDDDYYSRGYEEGNQDHHHQVETQEFRDDEAYSPDSSSSSDYSY